MRKLAFFKEGLKDIKTIGTVTKSSQSLCREMLRPIDFVQAKVIVELGAGDGVVTQQLLSRMHPEGRLFVFEVNAKFCKKLREKFQGERRLVILEESATMLRTSLQKHGISQIDCVVSALPLVNFSEATAQQIIEMCRELLSDDGLFIQIHYSLQIKKMYYSIFGNVSVKFVPLNLPPAFVLISKK